LASKIKIPQSDVAKANAEILQLRNQQFFIATLALSGSGLAIWFLTELTSESIDHTVAQIITLYLSWLSLLAFLYRWSLSLFKLLTVVSEFLKCSNIRRDTDKDEKDNEESSVWEIWYYNLPRDESDWRKYGKAFEEIKSTPFLDTALDDWKSKFRPKKPKEMSSEERSEDWWYLGEHKLAIPSQTELVKQAFLLYGLIAFFISLITLGGSATRLTSKGPTKIVETLGGRHGKERQVERRAKDGDCVSDSARRSRGNGVGKKARNSGESNS
jgi:hypothetical protein